MSTNYGTMVEDECQNTTSVTCPLSIVANGNLVADFGRHGERRRGSKIIIELSRGRGGGGVIGTPRVHPF